MVVDQRDVLSAYLALYEQRSDWARKFVLLPQLNNETSASAMAAMVAGAAVLSLTADAAAARDAMRAGCCDYVVNTLDEAVRILKNNLRMAKACGIALISDEAAVLKEMAERGIVADFIIAESLTSSRELTESVATDIAERRTLDAALQDGADDEARRWLLAAPVFFPRDLRRWVPTRPLRP